MSRFSLKFLLSTIILLCVALMSKAQDVLPSQSWPSSKASKKVNNKEVQYEEHIANGPFIHHHIRYLGGAVVDSTEYIGDSPEWIWVYSCDGSKSTKYPFDETYSTHSEHPGMKVYIDEDRDVYVTDGNRLLWVSSVLDWWRGNDKNSPTNLMRIKEYKNNAYGIKKESAGVQAYIKRELGLITWKQYQTMKVKLDEVGIGMRFLEQLKEDLLYLSKYSIKVKRLSPTSFSFTDEKNNTFTVQYSLVKNKIQAKYNLLP